MSSVGPILAFVCVDVVDAPCEEPASHAVCLLDGDPRPYSVHDRVTIMSGYRHVNAEGLSQYDAGTYLSQILLPCALDHHHALALK